MEKLLSKNVIFLANSAKVFISHRMPVAKKVKELGANVIIVAPYDEAAKKKIVAEGFIFQDLPLQRRSMNLINEIRILIKLIIIYRKLKPNIVFHATIKPVIYGSIAAWFVAIPKVINLITGLGYVFIKKGFFAKLLRIGVINLYRFALSYENSHTIFQNSDDMKFFIEKGIIDKRKTVLIKSSGVDIHYFAYKAEKPSDRKIIVLPARMLWDKGIKEFVDAANFLNYGGIKAKFWLAGGIDYDNPAAITKQQLEEWQEDGIITWLRHVDDMRKILVQSHIVCLPSYREGVPKALLEAAAVGRAIIATDVPGCREIVKDEKNGLLVEPYNPAALAYAIERLIIDDNLRKKMGKAGRKIVEKEFSDEIVVEKTIAVFMKS